MWRGAGVAVAYVGGIKPDALEELIQASGKHLAALKCGIAVACQTKEKAKAVSNDTEIICDFVFNTTVNNISKKIDELKKEVDYFEWLHNIETAL